MGIWETVHTALSHGHPLILKKGFTESLFHMISRGYKSKDINAHASFYNYTRKLTLRANRRLQHNTTGLPFRLRVLLNCRMRCDQLLLIKQGQWTEGGGEWWHFCDIQDKQGWGGGVCLSEGNRGETHQSILYIDLFPSFKLLYLRCHVLAPEEDGEKKVEDRIGTCIWM